MHHYCPNTAFAFIPYHIPSDSDVITLRRKMALRQTANPFKKTAAAFTRKRPPLVYHQMNVYPPSFCVRPVIHARRFGHRLHRRLGPHVLL